MPPIPIYTQSPINASKASGATPQTDGPAAGKGKSGGSQPTTTTAAVSSSEKAYQPAQPGAIPSLPVPTGTVAQSQRYAPVQPTPTTKQADSGPPAPQPGAVPRPPGASLPPPPKAGEHYQPPPEVTPAPQVQHAAYPPPQMGIPPPTMPYTASRGTSTAQPAAAGGMMGSSSSGSNLDHPSGYHQNVNASEFDSHQRAAHFANVSSERRSSISGDEDEGMWDSAKKLVQAAGSKLSAAENEVWRRINKE